MSGDTIVYAVGDIHGRADLLEVLTRRILDDAAGRRQERKVIVFLGDYVDRGDSSRGVIDFLIDAARSDDGFERVFLKGNHEDAMMRFLAGEGGGKWWIERLGGAATLRSYGVDVPSWRGILESARHRLRRNLPDSHAAFLESLKLVHREDGHLFVHAGLRPGVPLDEQDPEDLLWIRDEFLHSNADFGGVVVHGHTICWNGPEIRSNRIGIDTGACVTGVLTCLVLSPGRMDFLQTS